MIVGNSLTTDANSQDSRNVLPLEGISVLVVEDRPDQQRIYCQALQLADVTSECYVAAAIEPVACSSIDVIVMDLDLQGMDGIQTTQRLRERGFEGAIVAMTAHDSPDIQRRWFRAGCDVYLEKPFDDQTLVSIVEFYAAVAKRAI